jgi:hypothetical protein
MLNKVFTGQQHFENKWWVYLNIYILLNKIIW